MAESFRKADILKIAGRTGRVEVEELASRFGVTLQTIRRDLSDLAREGKLARVHGGAIVPAGAFNIGYAERRDTNAAAKAAIARLCASMIPDNSSVILNIGTSVEAVATELLGHRNLTAITNSIRAAEILATNGSFQVIVTGGMLRGADGGLVGEIAASTIENFKVDHAVIGTSALDPEGDLMDFDLQEVRVSKAIIGSARKVFLVSDHSKLERSAPFRIAGLRDVDALFTDWIPEEMEALCAEVGTEVHIADPAVPER